MLKQWWRLGGALGIGFVVLVIIAIVLEGAPPAYDDSLQEIRAYWADDGRAYLAGDYLFKLAMVVFLVPFAVSLRTMLGRAEGEPQLLSRVTLIGAIAIMLVGATASASWGALALASGDLGADSVRALMLVDEAAFLGLPFGVALFVLPASIVIAASGVVWRWLGAGGLIIGAAALLAPLGILNDNPDDVFDTLGMIVLIGFAIWTLVLSIAMVMRQEEPVA